MLLGGSLTLRLFDPPFQAPDIRSQVGIPGIEQEDVEAALALHRPDRMRRHLQAHGLAQRLAEQRRLLEVRQKPPAGLIVGVADVVSHLHAAARELAPPGYKFEPFRGQKPRTATGGPKETVT